jgi:CubicO group peptidase (beta-lactamase class C family)
MPFPQPAKLRDRNTVASGQPSRRVFAILSAALFAFTAGAADPGMDRERLARIPVRMQEFVDRGTTAGIVTLLMRHGDVALLSAVGLQDRESRKAMNTDTIFAIHSMTKPVTSTGIMILVDEGKVALIDPVEKYLPEFKGQKLTSGAAPVRPVNLRDLLTHTSGYLGGGPEVKDRTRHTLAEVVSLEARQPLQYEPGTKWKYSNAGMAALGRIIEVVAGKPYERFIEERILHPLGMQDSFFFPPAEKRSRIAAAYTDEKGALVRAKVDLYKEGAKYAAPEGGLYSTATDMSRFYQMMLRGGALNGRRILSPAAVHLMTQVQTGDLPAGFAPGMGWGLGWGIVRSVEGMFRMQSVGTYGHGGAWRTMGWVDPSKDLVGVFLMQRTNGGGDIADEMNAFIQMAAAAIQK